MVAVPPAGTEDGSSEMVTAGARALPWQEPQPLATTPPRRASALGTHTARKISALATRTLHRQFGERAGVLGGADAGDHQAHGVADGGEELVVGDLGVADHLARLEVPAAASGEGDGDLAVEVVGAVVHVAEGGDHAVVERGAGPLHGRIQVLGQVGDVGVDPVVDLDLVGGASAAGVGHLVVVLVDAQPGERVAVPAAVVVHG